jgi:chromosomal replication initiation ATPase DnaA
MVTAPRLPPLPGLVLNEVGAIRWMRVLRAVAAHHKISPSEITGKSRKRHVIKARFEVFYRLRVDLNFSYPKISQLMTKDHSTVLHGVNKVRQMLLDRRERSGDYGDPSVGNTHP